MIINMQNLLTQIFVLYEKHKILENEQSLGFNIFSILNMERKEVETHSFFIYELSGLDARMLLMGIRL